MEVRGNIVPMLELGSGFDFDLTGRENIYLNGSILGYSRKFLDEKYDAIVDFSELGEFIEMPIRNYSSGMMMRLAFSIATVVNPEILIVDEILAVGGRSVPAEEPAADAGVDGRGQRCCLCPTVWIRFGKCVTGCCGWTMAR